jgi:flagellar protein FliL
MKKIIIAIAVVIAAGAGLFFTGSLDSMLGGDQSTVSTAPAPKVASYLPLDPPFVVNFTHRGALRFLQLSVELMFYDASRIELAKQNMPAIRNDVIILLSGKDFDGLSSIESKEDLRNEILQAICTVLQLDFDTVMAEEQGQIYITNFIMQ